MLSQTKRIKEIKMKSTDTTNLEKLAKGLKKINPNNPLLTTIRKRYKEIKENALLPTSPERISTQREILPKM